MVNTGAFPIEQSSLMAFHRAEQMEIDKLKWLLSEKAGHDVGIDYTHWIWGMGGHRERWIKGLKAAGQYPVS